MALAKPFAPNFSLTNGTSEANIQPAPDVDAFFRLVGPRIEFIEGSSKDALAVPEGKYEPINPPPSYSNTTSAQENFGIGPSRVEVSNGDFVPQTSGSLCSKSPSKSTFVNGQSYHITSTRQDPSEREIAIKLSPLPKKAKPASSSVDTNGKARRDSNAEFISNGWPTGWINAAGLYNLGNSCFLNSALQALLHTPPLLHMLLAHEPSKCLVKQGVFCMSCNMKALAKKAHENGRRPFMPDLIYGKLQSEPILRSFASVGADKHSAIAKGMRKGRQEDSHEFLRYAIDALQKSCLAGHPPKVDPKIAETTWVHRLFGGRLRSRVHCQSCGHNSDTFDRILDLSLDIYKTASLNEALKRFVAIDTLKGDDKYKCEKCKKLVNATKQFTLHDAPHVLTIHLKRFSPLGRKIGHQIAYSEKLDLSLIMSGGQPSSKYTLYGVICHAGGGPNSGHYYAFVRGADQRWYEMNDDLVNVCKIPLNKQSAYMLFYIRDADSSTTTLPSPLPTPKKFKPLLPLAERSITETESKAPFIGPILPTAPGPKSTDEAHAEEKKNPLGPLRSPSKGHSSSLMSKHMKTKQAAQSSFRPTPLTDSKPSSALDMLRGYDEDEDMGVPAETEAVQKASSPPPSSPVKPVPSSSSPAEDSSPTLLQSSAPSTVLTSRATDFYESPTKKRRHTHLEDSENTQEPILSSPKFQRVHPSGDLRKSTASIGRSQPNTYKRRNRRLWHKGH